MNAVTINPSELKYFDLTCAKVTNYTKEVDSRLIQPKNVEFVGLMASRDSNGVSTLYKAHLELLERLCGSPRTLRKLQQKARKNLAWAEQVLMGIFIGLYIDIGKIKLNTGGEYDYPLEFLPLYVEQMFYAEKDNNLHAAFALMDLANYFDALDNNAKSYLRTCLNQALHTNVALSGG